MARNMETILVFSTLALAVFTYLVWRIQADEHRLNHFASLQVAVGKARFDATTRTVRFELLMLNTAGTPAVVQEWEAIVSDGTYRRSIADGDLGPTVMIRAPVFVGSAGWVIQRSQPTAICLKKSIDHVLTNAAKIDVEIHYAGGTKPVTILAHSMPIAT